MRFGYYLPVRDGELHGDEALALEAKAAWEASGHTARFHVDGASKWENADGTQTTRLIVDGRVQP